MEPNEELERLKQWCDLICDEVNVLELIPGNVFYKDGRKGKIVYTRATREFKIELPPLGINVAEKTELTEKVS